jgi:hypothetical protein
LILPCTEQVIVIASANEQLWNRLPSVTNR